MDPILLDLPMPIETPRLILRPPQIGEGHILNKAICESFEMLHEFMLWAKQKPSLEESEIVVRKAIANWILKRNEDPDLLLFIMEKSTNQFIGATGFHNIDWDVPSLETGYWINTPHSGKGYMLEALNAVTRYAFEEIGVKRIAITCDPDNIRSKNIPKKLGYQLDGILKANRIKPISGEVTDTEVFSRTSLIGLPDLQVFWNHNE